MTMLIFAHCVQILFVITWGYAFDTLRGCSYQDDEKEKSDGVI